jgi:hypothetical protein
MNFVGLLKLLDLVLQVLLLTLRAFVVAARFFQLLLEVQHELPPKGLI